MNASELQACVGVQFRSLLSIVLLARISSNFVRIMAYQYIFSIPSIIHVVLSENIFSQGLQLASEVYFGANKFVHASIALPSIGGTTD